ncbi:MAG: glycosyltransferase family 2 protein [Bacteroidetes bacterium]|nr:glycosyltransferase family 2 protein [Bacteroidota bacterium]
MKLIIQIPCYNEAKTLAITLNALPKIVEGFDCTEILIIDDGSTDDTVKVAEEFGVDHIISFKKNQGLAKVFMAGTEACMKLGADVIVNTDADNQYNADDIPALTRPILDGKADMVIGVRPIQQIKHFSWIKKQMQRLGSWVVRKASATDIPDAPSGFRAFSRNAAMQINVFNDYTYTLETIIQAGRKNMAITWVPVSVNEDLRPSRLVKSIPAYIKISILTILRIFITYQPLKFFVFFGSITFTAGFILGLRWLIFFIIGTERTRLPSLILTAILILTGVFFFFLGFVADLIAVNRKILEENQYRLRKLELEAEVQKKEPVKSGNKK